MLIDVPPWGCLMETFDPALVCCCSQVVLTDLNDNWRLMWIDGSSVRMGKCSSRAQAVALISLLVQQVGQLGTPVRPLEPHLKIGLF